MTAPATEQFREAIRAAGLTPPEAIHGDGKLRRFAGNGNPRDDSGWYVFHDDAHPAGAFGDWRSDFAEKWQAEGGREWTPAEKAEHRARVAAIERQRKAEAACRHEEAKRKAQALWKAASPAGADHPYLTRKRVAPVATLRELPAAEAADILGYAPKASGEALTGRLLLAPVKVGSAIATVEMIDEAGRKAALAGGPKRAGFWAAQPMPEGDGAGMTLLIGEGVATVLSAREATGHPALAALSCGNLPPVAHAMRRAYPAARLVILADLGNGEAAAEQAARDSGAMLAKPDFGAERPDGASDFNDLAQHRGADAVARAIAAAQPAHAAESQARCDPPLPDSEIDCTPARAFEAKDAAGGQDQAQCDAPNADDATYRPHAVSATEAGADPPPLDILRPLAAPPLRVADVPEVLARFADAHARATGFDVSILLAGGIVMAAAALSDEVRLCVSPRSGWFESTRLWLSLIGGPGSGKTPGLKTTAAPMFALHRELLAEWTRAHGNDDEPPPRPALYTSDATTEALADVLRDNPRGLLYFVDELESWLASHDAYRTGAGKDRGEWLRLYDGGPHQVNRVRRGPFFVPNWGASLLSATTPAALRKLAPKLPDDGLLQRLLLVLVRPRELPDATLLRVETRPHADAWDAALRRLYALPGAVVHLSGDARAAFEAEQAELHRLTLAFEDLHPPFAAHLAKRAAMLARLALTFHALDAPDIAADVSGDTMARAARFMRRQERHAQAVYSAMLGADTGMALAKAIARAILASGLAAFNRRELTPRCKAFRTADEQTRHAALSLLSDCGWLTCTANTISHGALWAVDKRVHTLFSEHGEAARMQRAAVRSRLRGDDDDD